MLLNKLSSRFLREELPGLPWIGLASGRVHNPPAPHLEVCLVLEGRYADLRIGERHERLGPGDLCVHGVHHGNDSPPPEAPANVWCLFIDLGGCDECAAFFEQPFFVKTKTRAADALRQAFRMTREACRRFGEPRPNYLAGPYAFTPLARRAGDTSNRLRLRAALLEMTGLLHAEFGGEARDASPEPEAIRRSKDFMELHYRDASMDLDRIATAAGLSVDHFGRLFRRHVGSTPMRYLRGLRMAQARALLTHTSLRIGEIARDVAFEDPYHFSRSFRAETGISPRAYRQRHRPRDGD